MLTPKQRLQLIRERLEQALSPTYLEIIDESEQHRGHPGAAAGGGHFAIEIYSPLFQNRSLLECQRLVYAALGDLLPHEIHAVRLKTGTNQPLMC